MGLNYAAVEGLHGKVFAPGKKASDLVPFSFFSPILDYFEDNLMTLCEFS